MKTLIATTWLWVLCGLLAVTGLWGRATYSAREHLALGERSQRGGDWAGAVRELGRAARFQAPGNPYATQAVQQLLALGREAEGGPRVDREIAKRAYMEVRAALLGARHVTTPHPQALRDADQHLAALWAQEEGRGPEAQRWHEQKLEPQQVALPAPGWSLLAILGAGLLVGAMAGLLRRGLDPQGRIASPATVVRWAALCAAGFAAMALGLWKA